MRGIAIVPTYRNLRTLPEVLAGLEAGGIAILVIDDGSDDGTGPWLDRWVLEGRERWVEHISKNRGKGAALELGLEWARTEGFDFALSVDSDGQHLTADAMRMAAEMEVAMAASNDAEVMLIGVREESVEGYPPRSMFGRRLWALGVRSLTGLGVADPVCGLRAYPLRTRATVRVTSGRYAWEEEFLVRAAWAGITLREIGIQTVYQPAGVRVSHFALTDWIDSFCVWLRLAMLRVFGGASGYRPRGPLTMRERSWRRLIGAAVFVGCVTGATVTWFIALPLLTWIAWRLHAPIIAAWLGFGLGAFIGST